GLGRADVAVAHVPGVARALARVLPHGGHRGGDAGRPAVRGAVAAPRPARGAEPRTPAGARTGDAAVVHHGAVRVDGDADAAHGRAPDGDHARRDGDRWLIVHV